MESTEVCENCRREIPSVNYVMHVAHCSRNVEICSDCGEPVHISLKEQHKKNNHETAECGQCGKDVIRSALPNHIKNVCSDRLVECATCGIEVRFHQLNDHELYCQSRTEFCNLCQKYVMIKDLDNHNCESYNPEVGIVTIPCEFCGQQVDVVELETHQSACTEADDEDDIHVINEPTSIHSRNHSSDEDSYMARGTETSDGCHSSDEDVYALPCEFCNELCPSDRLYAHQSECAESNDDDDNDDHDPEYFNNGQRRPGRAPTGPGVREDPFNMVTLHELLFGSVLNSMMTEPQTRHFETFDVGPWGFHINRTR